MSRAFIDRLRAARHVVTGHKPGTVKTTWVPRPGEAAGPDATPTQAALEAWLLHVAYRSGSRTHPLGYVGLSEQRWYTQSWITPHEDQLVIQASAPNNWTRCFVKRDDFGGVVIDNGGSRVVVGYDEDTLSGWMVGPDRTSVVFVPQSYGRRGLVIELGKRPIPPQLAALAEEDLVVRNDPTDRMVSALVRRFLITDFYLSPHDFFSFDGDLGIELGQGAPDDELREHDEARISGFTTAGELIEACLTDPFLGIPGVVVAERHREWVAFQDERNSARLLLGWR